MKISTEIGSCARIVGERKAVELCAKAGFDAWDFSMFCIHTIDWKTGERNLSDHPLCGSNYLAYARELKNIGLDNGIICNQSHAPFPTSAPGMIDSIKRAIECTAEAGGEICVVHPNNSYSVEENVQLYGPILEFGKEHNVKIATENMWNWDSEKGQSSFAACATGDSFNAHLDAVNDPFFVACLDIGHAEMRGSGDGAPQMIRALGKRLAALHIHDNDRHHDSHRIPFSMDIDFAAVAAALKEVDYQGYLTLEADQHMNGCSPEQAFEKMLELANSAKRIGQMMA